MKSNLFRISVLVILIVFTGTLLGKQIKLEGSRKEFPLFNRSNSKIYKYFLVDPGEKLSFSCKGADSLIILTRVIIEEKPTVEYQYSLHRNNNSNRIIKTAKKSSATRGMGGEIVSTYNKVALSVKDSNESFVLYNISESRILFKFNADIANNSNSKIDYIRFTPSSYESEKILKIKDKSLTYYSSVKKPMEVKLEGPIVLKIISRLIFDSNFVNKKKYRYEVNDNGEVIAEFTEDAYKSSDAIIPNETERIPSTGDVNIITLGKGIHNIQIKDGAVNRDIIFRLYISKSSVEITN